MKAENKLILLGTKIGSNAMKVKQAEESKSENAKLSPQKKRENKIKASNRPNKVKAEQESKIARPAFKKDPRVKNSLLMQAYQDYTMTHHQQISLYNVLNQASRINLVIYNPEIEIKEEKLIQTPEKLNWGTCITQLPNGKLFCYGSYSESGIALIIGESGRVQVLPSGTHCYHSSAIYFKNNVYCFGGARFNDSLPFPLSSRFDFDRNKWVRLAPLPKADSCCNSIIFNGNILISGWGNINLIRYSIGSNSFTTIPYQFGELKVKILINGERLYLIECGYKGPVHESEIGNDTAWRRIGESTFSCYPAQIYCSYNKEEAYIGCNDGDV